MIMDWLSFLIFLCDIHLLVWFIFFMLRSTLNYQLSSGTGTCKSRPPAMQTLTPPLSRLSAVSPTGPVCWPAPCFFIHYLWQTSNIPLSRQVAWCSSSGRLATQSVCLCLAGRCSTSRRGYERSTLSSTFFSSLWWRTPPALCPPGTPATRLPVFMDLAVSQTLSSKVVVCLCFR